MDTKPYMQSIYRKLQCLPGPVQALAYLLQSDTELNPMDRDLAVAVKNDPSVWDQLDADQRQWIDMMIGGNYSTEETRNALANQLRLELPNLLRIK